MTVPTHIRTVEDASRVAVRLERAWGMRVLVTHMPLDGREVLALDHEGDLMVDFGPDAVVRYYAPLDPRLPPLDGVGEMS